MSDAVESSLADTLAKHIQAANVLVLSGKLEDGLEKILLAAGRSISNKLAKRIFSGMGSLSSFSGKIEIAYLFELIDRPTFDDLMVVKDVRNIFAHTTHYIYFSTPQVIAKCRQLSSYKPGDDAQGVFYQASLDLSDRLGQVLDRLMLAHALKEPPSIPIGDED